MAHNQLAPDKANLFRYLVVLSLIVCALGIVTAKWFWIRRANQGIPTFPAIEENNLLELPTFKPIGATWLGIFADDPDKSYTYNLWGVSLSAQKIDYEKIITDEFTSLVDCRQFLANLCMISQSDNRHSVFTLHHYDMLTLSNMLPNPIDFIAISDEVSVDNIIAVTLRGILLEYNSRLYLKNEDTITTLYDGVVA